METTMVSALFEVELSTPIALRPEIRVTDLASGDLVNPRGITRLGALHITDAVAFPDGDYRSGEMKEMWVDVERQVKVQDAPPAMMLEPDEEPDFETAMLDAVGRVLAGIRARTNQTHIDHRHPVHAYAVTYSLADGTSLTTKFPTGAGARRMPDYYLGAVSLSPDDMSSELGDVDWSAACEDARSEVGVPAYEEVLADAQFFRGSLRFDMAVLFSAMAVELMLRLATGRALQHKGQLSPAQCDDLLNYRRNQDLMRLLRDLAPGVSTTWRDLEPLARQRNRIAHGAHLAIAREDAARAIRTARAFRSDVIDLLEDRTSA